MTKLFSFSNFHLGRRSRPFLRFAQQENMSWLSMAVAVLYLGWAVSQGVRFQMPPPSLLQSEPAYVSQSQPSPARDYLQIADWRLMGEATVITESAEAAVVATPLQLKLLGTFFLSQQPQNNYAVIQSSDGKQQKYRVRETLPEGAVLHAVEQNRIVLKHNQQLEYLQFEANPLALSMPADQSKL